VEIVGPRVSLKRFSAKQEVYTLNLSGLKDGYHQVALDKRGVNLPIGLEILGIRPRNVDVVIRKIEQETVERDATPPESQAVEDSKRGQNE
ncbi:MAG: hypothetical protein AAF202_14010, partial [Pseudomonadota bacterium]